MSSLSNSIHDYPKPSVTVDGVIFALDAIKSSTSHRKLPEPVLKVLLHSRSEEPFKGIWALPGGFLDIDSPADEILKRKVATKTGVVNYYFEQLATFDAPNRDPRGRVLSIAYLGFVSPFHNQQSSTAVWFEVDVQSASVNGLTLLAFDHNAIIETAIRRLQGKIEYTDIAFNLLPQEFTITQALDAYNVILGRTKYTQSDFRRKFGHLFVPTGKTRTQGGNRPAELFTRTHLEGN